ncbi:hypothetical protein PM076_09700 [Halorubrum ezzemoulense]|uniref:Uncharacterized protein n=1 Tax=Halorubrum ezzemoulense TaxID=337243 RepID=A0ABT4Z099_HALEZ|nr:hypothetical protein [Halorubrum ezzemoulense]MDB2284189.1 hypothetical protein [Halorubrum ezzemoulense]MDB2289106.1 hypothetical protein [Halorubrum ezzemoulense]MDB2291591.1 hypothetical protein [Halorubrum ezzemoulense]MDB2296576.1 hypothetical protein [Halorubrum ezzemoulense]MDB2298706.1 hypothetical protein [Halorubrum ezzemoulense]
MTSTYHASPVGVVVYLASVQGLLRVAERVATDESVVGSRGSVSCPQDVRAPVVGRRSARTCSLEDVGN